MCLDDHRMAVYACFCDPEKSEYWKMYVFYYSKPKNTIYICFAIKIDAKNTNVMN